MTAFAQRDFIDLLAAIIPPPKNAEGAPCAEDWREVEDTLGTTLPSDFKHLLETYGAGSFGNFVWIYSPLSPSLDWNLIEIMKDQLDVFRMFRRSGELDHPVFPESGGILPWSTTINGDILCWQSGLPVDEWNVVLNPSRTLDVIPLHVSSSSLVYKWTTGQLQPVDFPDNAIQSRDFRSLSLATAAPD